MSVVSTEAPMLLIYEYPHPVTYIPDYSGDYPVQFGPYPLGMVQKYNTLIWTRKYRGIGKFSLSLPFNETDNELLACGNLVGIAGRSGLMRITQKIITADADGEETIVVSGYDVVSFLAQRVITYSAQGTHHPVGHIKALLRNQPVFFEHYSAGFGDYVPDTYCVYEDGDRRLPLINWKEPSFTYSSDADVIFQPELLYSLLDDILSLCEINGYGVRITADYATEYDSTLTMYFEIYKGTDRSAGQDTNPHVVFDEKLGNVKKQTYTQNVEDLKTAGYAKSAYIDVLTGDDQWLVDIMSENAYSIGDQSYINGGSNPSGTNGGAGAARSEIGLTVGELTEPTSGTDSEKIQVLYDSCKQVGRNQIAGTESTLSFEVDISTATGPQWNVDYFLGDVVTFRNDRYGVSEDARIAEAEETYEPGKTMQLMLTLGDATITPFKRVKQISRRRG